MSYDALRRGRHSQQNQIYCVTTVTRDRQPLFTDIKTPRLLVHELRRLHDNGDVTSLAWVIMPDHLHWLIQLNGSNNYAGRMNSALQKTTDPVVGSNSFDQSHSKPDSLRPNKFGPTKTHQSPVGSNLFDQTNWPLSRVVKTLKARSALTINRQLGQNGSLWQRAYYDRAARKDEDIREIARYIIANPLRAGLAQNIGDYPHWDCIWMDPP
jgi:putative transposase